MAEKKRCMIELERDLVVSMAKFNRPPSIPVISEFRTNHNHHNGEQFNHKWHLTTYT